MHDRTDVADAAALTPEELLAYVRDPAHLSPEALERRRADASTAAAQAAETASESLDADEHNRRLVERHRAEDDSVVGKYFPPEKHDIRYRTVTMVPRVRLARPCTRARTPRPVRRTTQRAAARGQPPREPDPEPLALAGGAT